MFSGNDNFVGMRLIILAVGTPLFALLALFFGRAGNSSVAQSSKSLKIGLGIILAGFLVYALSFIPIIDQGFGSLGIALLGAALVFVGLVTTVAGLLKK